MTVPAFQTIRGALAAMRDGRLTAVALVEDCLAATDAHDRDLNVFAARADAEALLETAAAIDRGRARGEVPGALAGIPLGIKDIFATHDLPTTASSKVLAGRRTETDSQVVARLRGAGALIVGKTQTHEFAYGPTTNNEFAGPSRNPWNREHVPGGSSGGSAIAVATGMCLGATASDTGGSIRHPAALCGVSGLKPTFGLVGRSGVLSLSWSLDHAGPIARTVDDLAHLLQAMAGHDPADPGSVAVEIPDYVAAVTAPPERLRVGVPTRHFVERLEPDVRTAFEAALATLEGFGWTVEPVELPNIGYALGAELAILSAEASSYHREMMRSRAADVSANVRRQLDAGMVLPATDYLLGQRVRRLIIEDFARALAEVDVIATPTIPITAPRHDQSEVELDGERVSALNAIWRNAFPTNLTGSPTLCLPCGFSGAGLPISLQLIGRAFDETTLLGVGHRYQSATPWMETVPAACRPA